MLDPFAQLPNIVGAKHSHYAWITKTYELYSHDALQVPNLLGVVAAKLEEASRTGIHFPTKYGTCCMEKGNESVVCDKEMLFDMQVESKSVLSCD